MNCKDKIIIPGLMVRTSAGNPEQTVVLTPITREEAAHEEDHITLCLAYFPRERPDQADDVEDDDLATESFVKGEATYYRLTWEGKTEPLFNLNGFIPPLGKVYPAWYDTLREQLTGFINGCLLSSDWRLECHDTHVPEKLGGISEYCPCDVSPMEQAFRHQLTLQGPLQNGFFGSPTPILLCH